MTVSDTHVDAFAKQGAVYLPGLFANWVDVIDAGIARNMAEPSEFGAENVEEGGAGSFFDDYCNWQRIPEFEQVIRESGIRDTAAALMRSERVQLFHDHVLVKEPGTPKATPWHSDSPYYFVSGMQNVSFWIPIDAVRDATLRLISGSHLWKKDVLPTRWLPEADFYPAADEYLPVPDPDADPDAFRVLEWPMEPGDAVAFNYRSVHGARGNYARTRRRALSLRFVGDDARFVQRSGPTSPPFHGHDMKTGDPLRDDWFPFI